MGDPLGQMQVSAEGVQQRDQLVWQAAAQASLPTGLCPSCHHHQPDDRHPLHGCMAAGAVLMSAMTC